MAALEEAVDNDSNACRQRKVEQKMRSCSNILFIGQRPMSKTSDSSTAAYPDQPVPSAH
jgi:hypothetical protein